MNNLILLDIDGVLNPLFSTTLHEDGYIHFTIGWISWSLNSRTHGKWIKELSENNTIVWCSSWLEESNKASEFFNLPDFDYVNFENTADENSMWKLADVKTYLEKNSFDHVFWLDDEFTQDVYDWAKQNASKITLIPCDPAVGWVEEDFVKIKEYKP